MHAHAQFALEELGLAVSTGRVVDFRSREVIATTREHAAVPLIHASHVRQHGRGSPHRSAQAEVVRPS